MAGLLGLLGSLSPNEDATPNALQRFDTAINPEDALQKAQMQAQLQELQQKQAVQTALQNWATGGGGDVKSLYGALATTGDPSYLSKYVDIAAPKPKTTTIGGNIIQYDENNPDIAPKLIYNQPTADERKQSMAEEAKMAQIEAQKVKAKNTLATIQDALEQVKGGRTSGTIGAVANQIPGTNAYNLDATLQTIKANLGFDELMRMKTDSATGASGLGALNKPELEALQSSVANLKVGQSDAQLEKNIRRVEQHYKDFLNKSGIKIDAPQTPQAPKKVIRFQDLPQ